MISTDTQSTMEQNDTELVSQSLTGSREAFGRIVAQYQSLICSLAYSVTGSLTQSEDLAQETFVIAWKQLRQLREPAKLRSWLCSIARSVISGATRRQMREPAHGAETLDIVHETPAPDPLPSEHAISREEEAILWRSLEQIPELYREPLILFYREQQSVAGVAEELELSEDAVKQRLSRGRKLLTEEVTAFVEGTLKRTNPGEAFTLGVLAALPGLAVSARAATLGMAAAKGSAAAKAAAGMGLSGMGLSVLSGVVGSALGVRISLENTASPRERQFAVKLNWITYSWLGAFFVVLLGGISLAGPYWKIYPVFLTWAVIGLNVVNPVVVLLLIRWGLRERERIRREEAAKLTPGSVSPLTPPAMRPWEYRSRWSLLGLPLVHISWNRKVDDKFVPAKGWIACGDIAYGILFASGRVAVGTVSIGMFAVGGIAYGSFAVGIYAFGAAALGIWVGGALAVGYMAFGGAGVAWRIAFGGVAVAHDYAFGGSALARHANDAAAFAFAQHSAGFIALKRITEGFLLLAWTPMILGYFIMRYRNRSQKLSTAR